MLLFIPFQFLFSLKIIGKTFITKNTVQGLLTWERMRLGRKNAQVFTVLHCRAAVRICPSKMDGVVPVGCNSQLNWVKKVVLLLSQDFYALFFLSSVRRSSLVKQYAFYAFFCSKEMRKIRKAHGLHATVPELLASCGLDNIKKKSKTISSQQLPQ